MKAATTKWPLGSPKYFIYIYISIIQTEPESGRAVTIPGLSLTPSASGQDVETHERRRLYVLPHADALNRLFYSE
jgi:hypothetical protein